jgi:ribosomal protein S6
VQLHCETSGNLLNKIFRDTIKAMDNNQTSELSEKKPYELSFLVNNEGDMQEILKLLAQHQIEIRGEGSLRKLNLAYPIKRASEAYFGYMNFTGMPSAVKSLERDLNTNAAVLRALIVKLPKEKTGVARELKPRPMIKPVMRRRTVGAEMPRSPKPLSNEAIEKKIEEILQ